MPGREVEPPNREHQTICNRLCRTVFADRLYTDTGGCSLSDENTMNNEIEEEEEQEEKQITYAQDENSITIKITGVAFDNLKRIADALNATSWYRDNEGDTSPIAVLDDLLIGDQFLNDLTEPTVWYYDWLCGGVGKISQMILDDIDDWYDDKSPEHKARMEELKKQFEAHGAY